MACSASAPTGGPIDGGVQLSTDVTTAPDLPASSTCIPGAQSACACPGGATGVQVCIADGRSLGACQCGADAGAPVDVPAAADVVGCGPVIADPEPDFTSCAAPSGSPRPYWQCTSATICPRERFHNSVYQPGFRVTYLKITQPAALASAAILGTINPTLAQGTFLWGLQLDLTGNTFRTGGLNPRFTRGTAGVGLTGGHFAFFNDDGPVANGSSPSRYNPIGGALTVTGTRASTAMVSSTVNIPIFSDASGTMLLTQLPLDNTVLGHVSLTADRGCIGGGVPTGGRYIETTSRWLTEDECGAPYATIDADISVVHAMAVSVTIGGSPTPLCNIIAGANCATDPQSRWARQPDTTVNGAAAYHLRASFAAISADIAR